MDFIQNISAKVGSSFCGSASVLPLRHGHLKCMHNIAIVTRLCAMKIPHELIPKEHTCDCRGGQARLGTSNGVAPSTVVTDCLPHLAHPSGPPSHSLNSSPFFATFATDHLLESHFVCRGGRLFPLHRRPDGLLGASQASLANRLRTDPSDRLRCCHHVARLCLVRKG